MIPLDMVRNILSYDNRFVIRGSEIIQINRLDKTDARYEMLSHIQPTMNDNETCVFIKIGNHERYYYMEYSEDDDQNHFRFSIMDYDATFTYIEPNEMNDPNEFPIYHFSTDKLVR